MNPHEQLIDTLSRSETFRNYERAYAEAIGMPLALRPVETWQLPLHGLPNESPFCVVMAAKSRTCAACLQSQDQLTHEATNGPIARTCAYGLCEIAVPVKLGPQTIGFLQTGQVMSRKPTAASFQQAVAQAARRGVEIDNEPTKRAYFKTPVVTPKKLAAVTSLLTIFAEHLALKANHLVMQAAIAQSPIIAKAKQFINEHYAEELSLGQVSGNVNTSRFYFCKQFRKSTGLSFTEFVSRTRIEKAKDLLLNPNLRISEIAFAVGFQSLTHFNRMFKRIEGQSPTDGRDHLPDRPVSHSMVSAPTGGTLTGQPAPAAPARDQRPARVSERLGLKPAALPRIPFCPA
jgi:AraC-like DNA-binding protein/ligand-binding sensor protein